MTAKHKYLVVILKVSVQIPADQTEAANRAKAQGITHAAERALDVNSVHLDDWMVTPS